MLKADDGSQYHQCGVMMQIINVRETRERLSRLLDAVAAGEEVVILRRGKEDDALLHAAKFFGLDAKPE